jgi:peptidoglycan/xylan/chitin deacetylase (PgdA/CDA1 family)
MENRLKVALTHDIDRTVKTYQYITHFLKALKNLDLSRAIYQIPSYKQREKVYWNFDEIIDIENKYGVKSTFYFLIETIPFEFFNISNWKLSLGRYDIKEPRIVDIIHYLDKNGWEVGLHGSFRSFNDLNLLETEKKILENLLGHQIIGIRQHYLNLNENTWKIQQAAGFKYDTSWGFTRDIGFKENRVNPFFPLNDKFLVFPLAIMDFCYLNTQNRLVILKEIINTCIKNNSILVINWHNDCFNEDENPGFNKAYREIIEVCLDNDAYFNTLSHYYQTFNL